MATRVHVFWTPERRQTQCPATDQRTPVGLQRRYHPIDGSVDHVRHDPGSREYLQKPHAAADYLTRVTGSFLHPDLVNFDIPVRKNYTEFKARMPRENRTTRRLFVECSSNSVEKLTKMKNVRRNGVKNHANHSW